MLNHLRQRAAEALARPRSATLATSGSGGLQADEVPCQGVGLRLYLLLPSTSEHLVNLEGDPSVVINADGWRLLGIARTLPPGERPPGLTLSEGPRGRWSCVVEVRASRLDFGRRDGWGYRETLDLD